MVKIFDITQKGDIISCSYTPETSDLKGYVEVDMKTHEVKSVKYSEYEYGKKMYVAHVRSKYQNCLVQNNHFQKKL